MELVARTRLLQVQMKCDRCGNGFMKSTHAVYIKDGLTKYEHKCPHCGYKALYKVRYPTIRAIQIEDFREADESEVMSSVDEQSTIEGFHEDYR